MEIGCNDAVKQAASANPGIGFLSAHVLKFDFLRMNSATSIRTASTEIGMAGSGK